MAYADIYNAANDTAIFQPRCIVATWIQATAIVNESTGTPNHIQRLDWANKVLRGTLQIKPFTLAELVLQDSSIAANPGASTDLQIQTQVGNILGTLLEIG